MEAITSANPIRIVLADGTVLTGIPRIIQFIGDHPEVQFLCGISPSVSAAFPCRVCWVSHDMLHLFWTQRQQKGTCCKPRDPAVILDKLDEIGVITQKKQRTDALRAAGSLTGVTPAFLLYNGFGTQYGMLQASAQDRLHHFYVGLCKHLIAYYIDALTECDGINATAALALWSLRVSIIPRYDDPETGRYYRKFNDSIFTATGLRGTDVLALCFQMKYALGEVPDVFPPHMHYSMLKLLLQFEKVYLTMAQTEQFTAAGLDDVEKQLGSYISMLSAVFGPQSEFDFSMSQMKIHACSHMRLWFEQFGAWRNWCTGSYEKSHSRTKNHASRTNNKSHQERAMLLRDQLQVSVHSALRVAAQHDSSSVTLLEAGLASTADKDTVAGSSLRTLVPSASSSKLSVDTVHCALGDLTDRFLSELQHFLYSELGYDDVPVDQQKLRNHSGYDVSMSCSKTNALATKTVMSLQCRDSWQGKGPRCDDVVVQYATASGQTDSAYAKLLGFYSYDRKHELAYVRWYKGAVAVPARPVSISAGYLAKAPLSSAAATDVILACTIAARSHLIEDTQHRQAKSVCDDERYFINDLNDLCL